MRVIILICLAVLGLLASPAKALSALNCDGFEINYQGATCDTNLPPGGDWAPAKQMCAEAGRGCSLMFCQIQGQAFIRCTHASMTPAPVPATQPKAGGVSFGDQTAANINHDTGNIGSIWWIASGVFAAGGIAAAMLGAPPLVLYLAGLLVALTTIGAGLVQWESNQITWLLALGLR